MVANHHPAAEEVDHRAVAEEDHPQGEPVEDHPRQRERDHWREAAAVVALREPQRLLFRRPCFRLELVAAANERYPPEQEAAYRHLYLPF